MRNHAEWSIRTLRQRRGIAAVLLLAFALRGLVPTGFMPVFGSDFGVAMVICHGTMPMGAPGQSAPHQFNHGAPSHSDDHSPCPYGSSPAPAPMLALDLVPAAVHATSAPIAATSQVPYFKLSPRAQSARAPPSLNS